MYGRMWFTGTWKMIKVILIWTVILGMMVVAVVGCGGDDSPIKEDMTQPAIEAPNPYITPILGTWHLQAMIVFENEVQKQRLNFDLFLATLTFKPDKTFEVIHTYPVEVFADLEFLKSKELEHIQEIVVTFPGRYGIDEKQLRFYVDRARVEPKEAPEIDSSFEDPMVLFFYHAGLEVGKDTRSMDYSLVNNGNRLEFVVKKGKHRAEYIHHRLKPL